MIVNTVLPKRVGTDMELYDYVETRTGVMYNAAVKRPAAVCLGMIREAKYV
jgi:hypothetical protein